VKEQASVKAAASAGSSPYSISFQNGELRVTFAIPKVRKSGIVSIDRRQYMREYMRRYRHRKSESGKKRANSFSLRRLGGSPAPEEVVEFP
jgi:hypothetical protein